MKQTLVIFLMKQTLVIFFVAIALSLSSGCSDETQKTYPVYGIVQFRDGRILQEGIVEFDAMNRSNRMTAKGDIGPDGTFSLGTFAAGDGAVAGTYKVAVIADYSIGTGAERPEMLAGPKLHPKFRDFDQSGLSYTVRPGINEVIVKVRYAPPPSEDEKAEAAARRDLMTNPPPQ